MQQGFGIMIRELRVPYGRRLRMLRLARGWSQLVVAGKLNEVSGRPTISRHEVSRWERGDRVPGGFWQQHLATVFEVDPEEFRYVPAHAALPEARRRPRTSLPGATSELSQVLCELSSAAVDMSDASRRMVSLAAFLDSPPPPAR